MLARDISAMASYDGAAFKYLEAHVRKCPTYEGIRGPGDRPAWSRDPWPCVALEGRRKSRDQECRV
eukprot:5864370-Pyramimonas_sp.AAC.1